ncbi:unnamed protein product [Amoebophrya sp. A120]|nr:unnamed protein product [Amoebophrya sp. A120]|eukprot:GSA120T00002833001.1
MRYGFYLRVAESFFLLAHGKNAVNHGNWKETNLFASAVGKTARSLAGVAGSWQALPAYVRNLVAATFSGNDSNGPMSRTDADHDAMLQTALRSSSSGAPVVRSVQKDFLRTRFFVDILGARDAWLMRKDGGANKENVQQIGTIGLSSGFVRFQRSVVNPKEFTYEPGLLEALYPMQMVTVSKPDVTTERFLADPTSHQFLEDQLTYWKLAEFYEAEDKQKKADFSQMKKTDADRTTAEEREHQNGKISATTPTRGTPQKTIRVQLVLEGLEFLFHTRELFGNNLMDRIELIQFMSTQGKDSFLALPEISDYKNTVVLDDEKFDEERETFIEHKKTQFGEQYFAAVFEPHLPTNRARYWGFGGANDYRTWVVRKWSDFFDVGALDKFLKSRGGGGVLIRDVDGGGKQSGDGEFQKYSRDHAAATTTEAATGNKRLDASRTSSEKNKSKVRHMDVLVLGEALSLEPTKYVIMGHADKRVGILPCEDSMLPVKIIFFRTTYYFHRGVRCVRNESNPAWFDFPRLEKVLKEEIDFVYQAELAQKTREKSWFDVLKATGHWERDVEPLVNARGIDEKDAKLLPDLLDTLKFEQDVKFHDREYLDGQPLLRVGYYIQLGEALENDKMNLGKYQNWGPNTISATSAWSGVQFSAEIAALGKRILGALRGTGTTDNLVDGGNRNRKPLWVIHWRRGDGELGPTDARVQQFRQAAPENLAQLVQKTVVSKFFEKHLSYNQLEIVPQVKTEFVRGEEKTLPREVVETAPYKQDLEIVENLFEYKDKALDSEFEENPETTETNPEVRKTYRDFCPNFFIMTNEMDKKALDEVRKGFSRLFPTSELHFLGDFTKISSEDEAGRIRSPNSEAIESSLPPDDKDSDSLLATDLKRYLSRGGVYALLLEFYLACHADAFLGYQVGLFEGGASVPSMLINQLRLHQCGTPPSRGLFGPLKEYVKRYS